MIKGILFFILLTAFIWAGIVGFKMINGQQAVSLIKPLVYATISSTIALFLIVVFVEIF